ncbi:permease [Pyramidobacter sp. SM-530-WT-4B]|uniref:Permease n=1 Tax=Pyramidobacter porci TaxID=2605789 RepID=A0A6L5YCP4_9BACT|nr:permease [Pyramidobacter porci]MCI6260346.1 permease [Pyramidobacter sp.]MDY2647308.1 permease [Pyramidobacter porci]MST56041.1 permease [Pyramidobacter porci]
MWNFIQNQILAMRWLSDLVGRALTACGVDTSTRLGGSLQFFFFDATKIVILLSTLIFVISYIQSYFPPERTKRILGRMHGLAANTASALLGTVTPFCSCSSIPLFIGFTSAGLPVGVTFSFLISSPLVDLGSLILLTGIFGARIAAAYVAVGIVLAVAGGTALDRLGMEKYVEPFVRSIAAADPDSPELTVAGRLAYAKGQMLFTLKKVFRYVLVGVGIGALIHNWLPREFAVRLLGSGNPLAVVAATLLGIPMYADIFGTIPIAEALYAKGAGLGTVLSFMMAVTALSLPSLVMLRQAVRPRLLAIFTGIVALGIMAIGFGFNACAHWFI